MAAPVAQEIECGTQVVDLRGMACPQAVGHRFQRCMCSNVLVELAQSPSPLQIGLQGGSPLATGDGVEAVVFPSLACAHSGQGGLPAQGRAHLFLLCLQSCPHVRTFRAWSDGLDLLAQGADGIPMLQIVGDVWLRAACSGAGQLSCDLAFTQPRLWPERLLGLFPHLLQLGDVKLFDRLAVGSRQGSMMLAELGQQA